jgi:hypothetical protein
MTEAFVRNIQEFSSATMPSFVVPHQEATQGRRHAALLRRLTKREDALSVGKAQRKSLL